MNRYKLAMIACRDLGGFTGLTPLSTQIKRLMKGPDATATIAPHERFFAGASAGVIAQSFIYPMEVSFVTSYHSYGINVFLCDFRL
jgi:hypothetical protein